MVKKLKVNKEKGKMGQRFEEKIESFMNKLGFSDVKNREDFGEENVDVVGGWDNTLFIIECRWKGKKDKYNLRPILNDIKDKKESIVKGAKKHKKYSKYNDFIFILAVRNVELTKEDFSYAKKRDIYLWDENTTEFYKDLSKSLGSFTKFNLLGEMKIYPKDRSPIRVPAFSFSKNGYTMYHFLINPTKLLRYCYVARRGRGMKEHYQRMIKRNRINNVANYIEEENGFFPNNAIVAIDEDCQFLQDEDLENALEIENDLEIGILQFPRSFRSLWIIDGQHRLFGYSKSSEQEDHKMPVVAFKDIDMSDQMKIFIDINENQKSVDPNLIWDLHGETREKDEEGIISNAVKDLNKKGLLKDKIFIPLHSTNRKDKINLSAICIAIKKSGLAKEYTRNEKDLKNPIFSKGHKKLTNNLRLELQRFLDSLNSVFSKKAINSFVLTNGGISVMIYIFELILPEIKKRSDNKSEWEDNLEKYLNPIGSHLDKSDIQKYIERLSSEGGRNSVTSELLMISAQELENDRLLNKLEKTGFRKEVVELERRLASMLDEILNSGNKNWYKENIPHVYGKIKSRYKKRASEDSRKELCEFLTLGEIKEILDNARDKLSNHFVRPEGFSNWNEFIAAFGVLSQYRNLESHGGDLKIPSRRMELGNMYLELINNCIDLWES